VYRSQKTIKGILRRF